MVRSGCAEVVMSPTVAERDADVERFLIKGILERRRDSFWTAEEG
jgi:hypothetical protein